ncbi:type IV secretion system protein virB1 [Brucella abortus 90-0775]|uniref:lytic transglycosylase domain-containing protein n=1 Tax=Brucella abortus TaxID=235 RepID=UPI0002CF1B6E|nr:lytic transglycosylase domain-containing protein [Brucella abortus]ENR96228.1 type IV secretion system protein virB1 [Brucella abortus 84/26]EPG01941.1 type IV secretion system protein virB1 [Brucella abortus 90-0775]EPG18589.1 type IV secretion system protein virB1 [Brucella abortus 82-3893]
MVPFLVLAQQCAPTVAPQTMAAIVQVESGFNPYAIGVVGGRLVHQPVSLDEAITTAQSLEAKGWNFSLGIAQVNRYNLPKYGSTYAQAFDPCKNLKMGSKILEDCYRRAIVKMPGQEQGALRAAFSCYYAGNFTGGFKTKPGSPSYVQKVVASADVTTKPIVVVPMIRKTPDAAAAVAAPVKKRQPADRNSVLVDLHPSSQSMPATGTANAPVRLKTEQPATTDAPPGKDNTDGVVVF